MTAMPSIRCSSTTDSHRAADRTWPGVAGAAAVAALLTVLAVAGPAPAQEYTQGRGTDGADYPFVPTPPDVVAEMLEMADVSARDSVYDLGSGDGRIVITAARRYGAAGLGVELDSTLVAEARQRAAREGVANRVRMVRGDLFELDLSPATVVTAYLLPRTMEKLEPLLFRELRPGARIVAHDFDMDGWRADSVTRTPGGLGGEATLYLWIVPARVGGTWALSFPDGDTLRVRIDQRLQELRARVPGGGAPRVTEAEAVADTLRLKLSATGGTDPVTLTGTVSGGRISGRTAAGPWSGRLVAESDSSLTAWQGESTGRLR